MFFQIRAGTLDSLVPSVPVKAAVTLVAVAFVLLSWRGIERLHHHDTDAVPQTLRHFSLSALKVVVTVFSGVVVIAVWGLTEPLVSLFSSYEPSPEAAVNGVLTLILLATTYAMTDLVGRVTHELSDGRRAITEHQREIIYRLSQVSLYAVGGAIVLGLWRVDLGGFLVGAGFLGIVVGLAARQTLGALLAGFVLMFARPFEIGDWVEIGDHEGIVTDITIVNTRMQTFDGEYVMVPNDVVSSESVVNRSRKGRLRIEVDVGIDYDSNPHHAAEVATNAVSDLDEVLRVPAPQVVVKEFGESAVVLGVRAWIDNPSARRKWRTRTAIVGAVKTAFEREGVKIPFPQRELSGRAETGGFQLAPGEILAGGDAPTAEPDGGSGGDDADGTESGVDGETGGGDGRAGASEERR